MMAVPSNVSEAAHQEKATSNAFYRFPIDLDKTIDEMELWLNDQSADVASRSTFLFRSPSEICDIDLYPKGGSGMPPAPSVTNWSSFWTSNAATGDNMRERPYAHIYPRLTTKSNVFTLHMRCQAIKKSPTSDPKEFDPKRDQVVGEYRGSSVIERFIDPNDKALATYNATTERADPYYRFRVISSKQFTGH
jgi:hypothetical protein